MRIVILLAVVVATIAAVAFAFNAPDDVTIAFNGAEYGMSRYTAAILLFVLSAVVAVGWYIIAIFMRIPFALNRTAKRARFGKARTALADGLIAAEGGDPTNALKKAKKSTNLAKSDASDRKLSFLLAARAAEANGDWSEAEHAYSDLSREKGAELVGLRGLTAAAIQRGDLRGAETHTRKALALKSNASWPFSTLFELQTKAADWESSNETLLIGEKRKSIDVEVARRRRAVLLTAQASRIRQEAPEKAERLAADAARMAPSFPPAAYIAGRLQLAAGKSSKAQATIEGAWRIRPHPALALLWRDLKPNEASNARAKRLKTLANINPTHRESRILLVEAAMTQGHWDDAIETLSHILREGETTRLCTLMEAISGGRGESEEAARWSRTASSAAREADWSDIDPDGRAFVFSNEDWTRLVYTFGDEGNLIHPRYETYGGELETIAHIALPAPAKENFSSEVEQIVETEIDESAREATLGSDEEIDTTKPN
ncbi:heme biosynthesis protein HemY [Hirschia maritima]|uniref:heme biosynthesis protein HemY n=1 Tax=Hirschia maritima TaxID=1121961 RepID=UPI0003755862|nr:heme biosynthesis HemY N-terminal domain-containing protein [Hirschia maritima]